MIVGFFLSFWEKLRKIVKKDENFVFWFSLLFYFVLYFNPNNKTLLLFFALFILILFIKFKNLEEAFFWGFITSIPIVVGKTYSFNLIPANELSQPNPNNPEGYNVELVITTGNIIALFMVPLMFKTLIIFKKKQKLILDFSLFLLFLLIGLVLLSTLNSQNPTISFLFFLTFLEPPLVFIYARYLINWRKDKTKNILYFLLSSQAIFESLWVILQFVKNGPLGKSIEYFTGIVPFGLGADEDVWRYRPTGTFNHANLVAVFLLPIIILNFSSFYSKSKKPTRKIIYFLFPLILSILALGITLGRSAWFSLFLGVIILSYILEKKYRFSIEYVYEKWLLILAFLVLIISPFFLLPRITSTFNSFVEGGGFTTRIELIKESLEVIKQNPLLGVGIGMSVPEMFKNNPRGMMYYFPTPVHNWYLFFASEAGIPALLTFIFLLNSCLRKIFFVRQKNTFLTGTVIAVLAILINGVFQPFLGSQDLLFIFLGILASVKTKT